MEVARNYNPDTKRYRVDIAFFTPVEQNQLDCTATCINGITAWWTRDAEHGRTYSHVELIFSDGASTSVIQGETVHLTEGRLHSNLGYRCFFTVELTGVQEKTMRTLAEQYVEKKVPFNKLGMWWNFAPLVGWLWPVDRDGSSVFCSEYVTLLLQSIGYLQNQNPYTTSPNDLWKALKNTSWARPTYNRRLFLEKQSVKSVSVVRAKSSPHSLKKK